MKRSRHPLGRARRWGAAIAVGAIGASVLLPVQPAAADNIRDREYWLADYGITQAWNTTRGEGVTIAVIDTGIDSSHQDLRGAVTAGADLSGEGSPNGQTPVGDDGAGHGTMVASLAAGRGNAPGDGVIGVAPGASLLSISIGFGDGGSDQQIADAVRWAVDHGAQVINMSLTRNTLEWPESWDDAFLYAQQHEVVIVAAAGNRGSGTAEVGAPATMPGVLTVAGVDENGRASFDASAQGITIGVSAPSEELVGAAPGGAYVSWSGTSGATPLVSGVVALVRSAHPELNAASVIARVIETARDAGSPGADPIYGFGLIDAAAAVNADVPTVQANPMGDLVEWIRLNRRAEQAPAPEPSSPPPSSPPPVTPSPSAPHPAAPWLPPSTTLALVGVPIFVVSGFAAAFIALAVAASVHFRGLRRRR